MSHDQTAQPLPEPEPAIGDDTDWFFVTEQLCPECDFDPHTVDDAGLAGALRATTPRWRAVLARDGVRIRPRRGVWSPLEYACHVRDVHRLFAERLGLMLAEDGVGFVDWDPDAAAVAARYWEADPARVADEVAEAATAAADAYDAVRGAAWSRRGVRSDGATFTVSTLGRYHLHDVTHHLVDVGG